LTGPHVRPLAGLAAAVMLRQTSAEELAHGCMAEIVTAESGPERLNAFISHDYDGTLERARAVDRLVAAGRDDLPLAGVPVAVKDNICTLTMPTTCGSRILTGYRSPFEATAVRRLTTAGAVMVGKTNLDEFGMGSSTENSAFGATRNPHDRSRVAGGSSGGSAAAVAAGLVPAALGSETGGSVRQPAAFCGIVGIKPSYGRVSRYGLVAYASSLDQIGVFGRSVADAALMLQVISGHDPLDATTDPLPVPDMVTAALRADARVVIGVPDEYFGEGLSDAVRDRCEQALDALRAAGATLRRVSLPHTSFAIPTYYVVACAEASANLARFDGVRYGRRAGPQTGATDAARDVQTLARSAGFGAEVRRRIMLGTFVLSAGYHDAYYGTAQRVRTLIRADFDRVFSEGVDVLFTPTTPTPAFRLGEKADDPYTMYLSDIYTVTANLAALPAMSVPIGTAAGLPVGGQLIAPQWQEPAMIGVATALERSLS
jgi:aspartyl-tRNA(Asn)/glutamyl-tRNA(Gln) amidotransferase subunit A